VTVDPWRVAQIAADRGPGHAPLRGSGYAVAPGRVLTAAHVVIGASVIRVRLDVGQDTEIDVQADSWWADPAGDEGTDLAVITIPEDVTGGRTFHPARFGRISDSAAVLPVDAFGFPLFKLRDDPASAGQGGVFRDFEQAAGHAPVAANRRQRTLAVYLHDPPPPPQAEGDPSPWAGMSGGPVWAAGRIVAVVAEHYASEGTGRLTARRLDRAYEQLSASELDRLSELLGLPAMVRGLPNVVPAGRGQLVRSAYLAQVRDYIAPDTLFGRERTHIRTTTIIPRHGRGEGDRSTIVPVDAVPWDSATWTVPAYLIAAKEVDSLRLGECIDDSLGGSPGCSRSLSAHRVQGCRTILGTSNLAQLRAALARLAK